MEHEYITIAEAATRTGKTPQAIYKRLKTSLQPYVKVVDNKKWLHISVIDILNETQVDNMSNNVAQPLNNELLNTLNRTQDILQEQLKLLQQQLEVKDMQISELNERLEQALRNSSESHYVLAQHQQKALEGPTSNFNLPWYKRLFKSKNVVVEGGNDVEEV